MLAWPDYLQMLIALVIMVDPLGGMSIFLGLTSEDSGEHRARVAKRCATSVSILLILSALVGQWILNIFGIRIPSLQVGAGVLFLLIGLDMIKIRGMTSRQTPEERQESKTRTDISVVPLAIPLLAGPGAISAMIVYAHQGKGYAHLALVCLLALAMGLIVWIVFRLAGRLGRILRKTGVNIIERLMGLVLMAVAVEFLVRGLTALFPLLGRP